MLLTLPFSVDEYVDQAGTTDGHDALDLDHLLGQEFDVDLKDGYGTRRVILVELNSAAATSEVRGRCFKWDDRATHKVALADTNADRIAGVGYISMVKSTVPDTAYLLLQKRGRCKVIHSSEATNTLAAARPYATVDGADTDDGKVLGTATYAEGSTFARFVSGTAADDAEMVVELLAGCGD